MLEVMNAGSTDLSRADSAMILNCWEKSSTPLIKELEQTVTFAERKCGDLMQQLHFYKEYYEKWIHSERLNHSSYQKKKNKKCSKISHDVGSSSENEFEKVNQYFYRKIRNKITEMNQEITMANRKLHDKYEFQRRPEPKHLYHPAALENFQSDNQASKSLENKTCKSEPLVTVCQVDECKSAAAVTQEAPEEIKVTEKQSSKSVPLRDIDSRVDSRKTRVFPKRRYSNLQRFKLRSKSLPQGVRRKFGFGGFIEIIDPKVNIRNSHSKSRTSIKMDSYRSFKTFKSDGQVKAKANETKLSLLNKLKKNQPISARSLQYRASKAKMEINKLKNSTKRHFLPESKQGSVDVVESVDKLPQNKNNPSQSNCGIKTMNPCKEIVPTTNLNKPPGVQPNIGNLNHLISKPNSLIPFLRQPIPFIPCSSTSKTFNLGLNVQQVLSMIKHRRHSITLQTVIKNGMRATRSITEKLEPTVNTLFFSQTTTSHSQVTSSLCPARACIEDTFSIVTDDIGSRSNCTLLKQAQALRSEAIEDKKMDDFEGEMKFNDPIKLERPEDVWVVEQPDNTSREFGKSKSRCTCYPSKHCVDYHKVLREYTGWKMPSNKTNSFPSDGYSTYQPMMTYQKPKLGVIPSQENVNWSVEESEGKIALMKVHNDLLNINRKYSLLEEQIIQRNLDDLEANAELDAMESELSIREMEFKDIINFYQQLIQLKEKLKTLRPKSAVSTSQTTIQQAQRPKKDPLRPTPSMALTKVLRKIQGLQDKIKLIDAP